MAYCLVKYRYVFMAWCLVKHRCNFTLNRHPFRTKVEMNSPNCRVFRDLLTVIDIDAPLFKIKIHITDDTVHKCNKFLFLVWLHTKVYPKVSGLAAWSENCKWFSSLPLGAVVALFCESVLMSFAAITLCLASQRVLIFAVVHFVIDSVRKLLDTPSYIHCIEKCIK
jgi:hypothetical protein